MNQKKSSVDPAIRLVFLLKNFGFLFIVIILFTICFNNTYDRVYGDNHYKNKLENLLKNGKTIIAQLDENYVSSSTNTSNHYEFTYSFKVKDKVYKNVFSTKEFIPQDPNRLIKFLTVHYLPEDPDVNQIDAELEYEYAKDKVNEHGIGMLLLNIFGLFITFILILYTIIGIKDKIKNINEPIENPYKKAQLYNEVSQKTDYSNLR